MSFQTSAFGNLPIKPLYNMRSFLFAIGRNEYLTIFRFFTSKVWKIRRSHNISLTDFNLVLNSLIYIRLNPFDVSGTQKLKGVFNLYGVPPGISRITRLLPKSSDRSFYAGRINFNFSFVPSPEELQDALANIVLALNGVRCEMISFDEYETNGTHHTEVLSFFRKTDLDGGKSDQFSLSLPGQSIKLCDSICFSILFNLTAECSTDELREYDLVFKQLYVSEFSQIDLFELERLALDSIFPEDKLNRDGGLRGPSTLSSESKTDELATPATTRGADKSGKRSFSSAIVGEHTIFILDKNGNFLREHPISHRLSVS